MLQKMPPAICRVAVRAFTGTHGGAAETGIFLYGSGADFDQIWIEHADKLYESSGLKQEDMEYIYNLGQTIGYLDVQAQEEGLALLQADLGRHIRELEAEAKDRMRLALVVGSVAGVLLIIILI